MSAQPANPIVWRYQDSAPVETALRALETAKSGQWGKLDLDTAARYLRALLVLGLQAATLKNEPARVGEDAHAELGPLAARQHRTRADLWVASTVARTPLLLAPPGHHTVFSFRSLDGNAGLKELPSQNLDTAFPPLLLAAVWIVGIVATAVATVYIGQSAAEVVDRQLTRSEDSKRLLGSQATAIQLIADHSQREKEAGHPIDWTPQELAGLHALLDVQKVIANKREIPLPSPFPGALSAFEKAGRAITGIGETLLPIAGILALVHFWPRGH